MKTKFLLLFLLTLAGRAFGLVTTSVTIQDGTYPPITISGSAGNVYAQTGTNAPVQIATGTFIAVSGSAALSGSSTLSGSTSNIPAAFGGTGGSAVFGTGTFTWNAAGQLTGYSAIIELGSGALVGGTNAPITTPNISSGTLSGTTTIVGSGTNKATVTTTPTDVIWHGLKVGSGTQGDLHYTANDTLWNEGNLWFPGGGDLGADGHTLNSITSNNINAADGNIYTGAFGSTIIGLGSTSGTLHAAAFLGTGTSTNDVIQWEGSGVYPAGDGSAITGITASVGWPQNLHNGTSIFGGSDNGNYDFFYMDSYGSPVLVDWGGASYVRLGNSQDEGSPTEGASGSIAISATGGDLWLYGNSHIYMQTGEAIEFYSQQSSSYYTIWQNTDYSVWLIGAPNANNGFDPATGYLYLGTIGSSPGPSGTVYSNAGILTLSP